MEEKKVKQNTATQKFPASNIPLGEVLGILARVRLVYDIAHWPKGWRFPHKTPNLEHIRIPPHLTTTPRPRPRRLDGSITYTKYYCLAAGTAKRRLDGYVCPWAPNSERRTSCRSLWYRPRLLAPDTNIGRTMCNLLRGSMPFGDHRAITLSALPVLSRMHHPFVAAQHGMSDMSQRRRV
jgi:hypothetical protein